MQILRKKSDGSEQTQITDDEYNNWFPHVSQDGRRIVFISYDHKYSATGDHLAGKNILIKLTEGSIITLNVILLTCGNQSIKSGVCSRKNMIEYFTINCFTINIVSLNVAIDTDKSAHHSLQLIIDDNVISNGDEFYFYHNGRIAVGNIGSGKINELKTIVLKYYPNIINNNKIYLGNIINNKLFELNDVCIINLIENLISYSLIRDLYRNNIKKQLK